LYALLTGISPPHAQYRSQVIVSGNPDPLRAVDELNPKAPHALCRLVEQAMALDPRQRPPSAAAMQAAIRQIQAGTDEPVRKRSNDQTRTPFTYQHALMAVGTSVLLVWAAWFFGFREPQRNMDPAPSPPDTSQTGNPPLVIDTTSTGEVDGGNDSPSTVQNNETPDHPGPDGGNLAPDDSEEDDAGPVQLSGIIQANLYLDRAQGQPLNGQGIIHVDGDPLDASQWNDFELSAGTHRFSATFRGVRARRITLSYSQTGQDRNETYPIDDSGEISLDIRPAMQNLRILLFL
jgi:hypothetical protein